MFRIVVFLALQITAAGMGLASDAADGTDKNRDQRAESDDSVKTDFFERQVRPLLEARCVMCHGEDEQESGLRLDSLSAALAGGERGPALVPGQPDASLLIHAVNHTDDLQMPPKEKLAPDELMVFERWIRDGARWPGYLKEEAPADEEASQFSLTDEDRQHWAFQPVADPAIPVVRQRDWCQQPLDRFVLHRLEQEGIVPAPAADRRQLVRRMTFGLTGLPPTPHDVDTFVSDRSPIAIDRLIDRLLASPHYGEHWGRLWFDVVRYADSNGMDENLAFAYAYPYRDYVIASMNRGKSYRRFLQEQVAGDVMPSHYFRNEQEAIDAKVATAIYAIGPKMLADDDGRQKELDTIDELIRTFGRGFLGLTLDCARCHDHKFDPISTSDYYGLAGIFKSTKLMDDFGSVKSVVAMWHLNTIATEEQQRQHDAHQAGIDQLQQEIESYIADANNRLQTRLVAQVPRYLAVASQYVGLDADVAIDGGWSVADELIDGAAHGEYIVREAEDFDRGNIFSTTEGYGEGIGIITQEGDKNHVEYDVDLPAAGIYQLELRYASAQHRSIRLRIDGDLQVDDVGGEVTGGFHPNEQRWHVAGTYQLPAGRVTLGLEKIGPHLDKWLLVPVNRPTALNRSLPDALLRPWVAFLRQQREQTDARWQEWEQVERKRRQSGALTGEQAEAIYHTWLMRDGALRRSIRDLLIGQQGPCRLPDNPEEFYTDQDTVELATLRGQRQKCVDSLPQLPRVMGVAEGDVQNMRVHIRGSYLSLGDEVPRRFPELLALGEAVVDGETSGRWRLAQWLTRDDHPLTARVLVNRIWAGLFGEGLVRSPNNLGQMGSRPDHPELLDHLTTRFIASGWSIKRLQRYILTSRVYQMGTDYHDVGAERDPDNRWLWRFPRRRLTAEQFRDATLAVSGSLDRTMYGQLLQFKDHTYITSTSDGRGDGMFAGRRRTVYLPVVRSALFELLQTFDFPDPSVTVGARSSTTVPSQALAVMNSDEVAMAANWLAQQSAHLGTGAKERIDYLFSCCYGRSPTAPELGASLQFVDDVTREFKREQNNNGDAWRSLCRVLLGSNEFLYLE